MKGRLKANSENILILAHQTAAFIGLARAGKLKSVETYLRKRERKRGTDAAVFKVLEGMKAKGLVTIREVAKGGTDGE